MEHASSEPTVSDQPTRPRTQAAASGTLIFTAWVSTLLLSKLPLVVARDVFGTDIPWILTGWLVVDAVLIAAASFWPALRPLRAYFIVMAIMVFLAFGITPAVWQTSAWQNSFVGQAPMTIVFAERVVLGLQTLVIILALALLGVGRREAFLTIGNLRAQLGGRYSPDKKRRPLSWAIVGPIATLVLAGLFFAFLGSQSVGRGAGLAGAGRWLPLILLTAALNAFVEEVGYRAAPLSVLVPVVGPVHALLLTSLWFGLGHYYGGIPSGLVGFVQTGPLALFLGKMMLDTRGLGWSWIVHVVLDTVIYLFVAAAA